VDSRNSILDTATELFARQGFAGVSLRAIAERVGITKPSLLYHFASKDVLRESVLDKLFEHWATTLPRLLRAVTSGEGQFEVLMQELVTFFRTDADRARLIVRELMDRPDEMRRRVTESLTPLVRLIADTVRKGQALGQVQGEADPEAYILHMIGLTLATVAAEPIVTPVLSADRGASERYVQELLRIAHSSLFSHERSSGARGRRSAQER
jgi:AcrR family transcriptional regulator